MDGCVDGIGSVSRNCSDREEVEADLSDDVTPIFLPTDHKYTGAVTVAKRFSRIHLAIIYDLLWNVIAKLARCLLGLILMK